MQKNVGTIVLGISLLSCIQLVCSRSSAGLVGQQGCQVVQQGNRVELHSPFFVFRLVTGPGLQAQSWENRLTGQTISLADGPELEVDLGIAEGPKLTPQWQVTQAPDPSAAATGEAVFKLTTDQPKLSAVVTYRWDASEPVLRKFVEITNESDREINRLLNVRLGDYGTDADVSGGQQGFPAYLNGEFFMSLAHPSGWSTGENGKVQLRHYPGIRLAPGGKLQCMEALYGVGGHRRAPTEGWSVGRGGARKTFLAHVRSRTRRVVRGHDKPYAIFEPFGARPGGNFDETEEFVLDSIAKVAEGQRDSGCHFDLYSVDFWVDYHGDVKGFDPVRFPNGLTKIKAELAKLGTAPGLWIDSSMTHWSIGGNPAVKPTFTHDPKTKDPPRVPVMCRATEPIKSMYTEAFRYHIRENGARLLKFDNLQSVCNNPNHEHLPGIYSTEAIQSAVIEFLHALDEECPDVFLMLYWGHRSPWWLLHADTLFDSGIGIEAASPSSLPAPHARDSITQRLDQAQWHASDVPPLGKESLGVWLSDWGWNSSVGKERWEAGVVMDICRGSLLAQIWSDTAWLSPPERKQMADFIALLRAQPACFANPRFILGNPWEDEPYGYCCTDGHRAFLAINNCAWKDSSLSLKLNSAWGLPDGGTWNLYRCYPDPAQLRGKADTFGEEASISLRPFEVVLLEAVPSGQSPSLDRPLEVKPIPTGFAEASRTLEIAVEQVRPEPEPVSTSLWTVLEPATLVSAGGATLTKQPDGSILAGGKNPSPDTYTVTAVTELTGITGIRLEALPDSSLPSNGPGRVFNGNFALNEFRVTAAPKDHPTNAAPVALKNPVADFSQESHGGWPIAAALDGDPETGWSVDPQEGCPHVAMFETKEPLGLPGGTVLTFTLDQRTPAEHNLGRLRLSVTTAKPPFPLPKTYGPRQLVVSGEAPASTGGGILVVTVEMKAGSGPVWLGNVGTHFSSEGKLAGEVAPFQPVLGGATYPSPWQAWRIAVEPAATPQPFELSIGANVGPNLQLQCQGHFIAD
ncbi:MAG: hypothetical protein A2V98_03705 [Planctomycetes bacterium RBG_16_64_12]|nr:MAG: hypothetical protein A2V98_03705 [Planctomycetes bacterium RBG_16_64_12]